MLLLSVDAGLRAKEVANLSWSMVTDSEGEITDVINLHDSAAKGRSGGTVYMSKRLYKAFKDYEVDCRVRDTVIVSQKGSSMSAQTVTNWFYNLYRNLRFDGCSSHSGRRTAITTWARKIHSVGGSMRDVQMLARHSSLQMTQRYIDVNQDSCRIVVD